MDEEYIKVNIKKEKEWENLLTTLRLAVDLQMEQAQYIKHQMEVITHKALTVLVGTMPKTHRIAKQFLSDLEEIN